MRKCSIAVYKAKAIGRNSFAFFDEALQASILDRHRTEKELRLALQQDQLVPYFQGQVDGDGNVRGAELLMRWQHPERGLLPPSAFIDVAEGGDLIIELGYLAIEMAVRQLTQWAACEHTSHWTLSVNISAKHFEEDGFGQRVAALLSNARFRTGLLKLEVTENSALLHDIRKLSEVMNHLGSHGVLFSLDDFGTGYSSLSYLKHLPIAELKIDRGFVRDLLTDENDCMITSAIIGLAAALNLDVVAEGVETEVQLETLSAMGCSIFQGFFFDHPAPIEQFIARHRRNVLERED
jgi:EAL domain-containing protein (putative c-di-GMP-specific phosphodiesterase class I)